MRYGVGLVHNGNTVVCKVLQIGSGVYQLVVGQLYAHVGIDGTVIRGVGLVYHPAPQQCHHVGVFFIHCNVVYRHVGLVGRPCVLLYVVENGEVLRERFSRRLVGLGV